MGKSIVVQGGGDLQIGGEYEVRHSRKGIFRMVVTEVSGQWITGTITDGAASAIMAENVRREGEPVTIRDAHSYFIPILKSPGAEGGGEK